VIERIGVAGAGTMGAGIAQLSALGGYETLIHDPQPDALERGSERLRADLERGAERGRWTAVEADAANRRLLATAQFEDLGGCGLVIEAVPEDLELKRELFARLEAACGPDAVLATNT
jgi:3-hydroxybutyryl-CoA dehydrogenase